MKILLPIALCSVVLRNTVDLVGDLQVLQSPSSQASTSDMHSSEISFPDEILLVLVCPYWVHTRPMLSSAPELNPKTTDHLHLDNTRELKEWGGVSPCISISVVIVQMVTRL